MNRQDDRREDVKIDWKCENNMGRKDALLYSATKIERLLYGTAKSMVRTVSSTRNWWDVVFLVIRLKKSILVRFRNGAEVENVSSYGQYAILREKRKKSDSIELDIHEFEFRGRRISMKGMSEHENEVFDQEIYRNLKCEGRVVIDIGANIGDSAIYFAAKSAKSVVAYEPYPVIYKTASENIRMNNMDNISLVNAAIGPVKGELRLDPGYGNSAGSQIKEVKEGVVVPVFTLAGIIAEHGVSDGILKVDCEGYEYSIFLEADDASLRTFREMQIEYHYGYLNLKKRLEKAGFRVRTLGMGARVISMLTGCPAYCRNEEAALKDMAVGFIFAERLDKP